MNKIGNQLKRKFAIFLFASCILAAMEPTLLKGQSCGVVSGQIETRYVSTNKSKCSFPEFQQSSPPLKKVYRKQRIIGSESTVDDDAGFIDFYTTPLSGGGASTTYDDLSWSWQTNLSLSFDLTDEYMRPNCALTKTYQGNKTDYYEKEESGYQEWQAGNGVSWWKCTNNIFWRSNEQSLATIDGGTTWKWVGTYETYSEMQGYITDGIEVGESIDTFGPDTQTNDFTLPEYSWITNSPTQKTFSTNYGAVNITGSVTLSEEYTDENLIQDIRAIMPPFPETWNGGGSAYFKWNSADHVSGSGAKLEYRIGIWTQTQMTYLVKWDVISISHGGASTNTFELQTLGNGAFMYVTNDVIDVPGSEMTNFVGNLVVTTVKANEAGNASFGCSSCSGEDASSGGPNFAASMGESGLGQAYGDISLSVTEPTFGAASPEMLKFISVHPDVEVSRESGNLRQVKTARTLADIVTISTNKYEIRYYLASDISGPKTNNLYPITNSAFVTWIVENPVPETNTHLRISKSSGGALLSWEYFYTSSNSWRINDSAGIQEKEVQSAFFMQGLTRNRRVTEIIRSPGGADVYRAERIYKPFSWGEGLVQEITGSAATGKKASYTYYDSSSTRSNAALKTVVRPDGTWEWHGQADYLGRETWVNSGFNNVWPTDQTNICRHVSYSYTPVSSADNGSWDPYTARTTREWILGTLVSEKYLIFKATNGILSERQDILSSGLTGGAGNPTNLVTTTKYITDTNDVSFGRVRSVENPDGTITLYARAFTNNQEITTTYFGQPNVDKTAVIDGRKTITVSGDAGQIISEISIDILSAHIISSSTTAYPPGDVFYKSPRTTELGGKTQFVNWGCCNMESEIDSDGVQTTYHFDALNRSVGYTRNNITISNALDAAGRTLKTVRIGTNGTEIVLSQEQYDLAGDLVAKTNAVGGVTSFSRRIDPTTGELITVIVNPDYGTVTNFYYRDGSLKMEIGSAVYGMRYTNCVGYTEKVYLNTNGTDSAEWTRVYTDAVGRQYKTTTASSTNQLFYNVKGQLWKEVDPDGVVKLYQYNGKGDLEYTVVDMDRNNNIDFGGADRITRTLSDVATRNGTNVLRARTYVWRTNGIDLSELIETTERSTDGLQSWRTQYRDASTPVTSHMQTDYNGDGSRFVTTAASDGSYDVSEYSYGRLLSVTRRNSAGGQIGKTTYMYDPHGRQSSVIDARNGSTLFAYNNADSVDSVTTPSPATGGSPQVTTAYYNKMLQATNVVKADGTSVSMEYLSTGALKKTYGSRTYPVDYTYDYAGRVKTMTTWQDYLGSNGMATTTWNYDSNRGFLMNKTLQGGSVGPAFTYSPAGRVATRQWSSASHYQWFAYNNGGDVSHTGTPFTGRQDPFVLYSYNRAGRIVSEAFYNYTSTNTAVIQKILSYNLAGQVVVEAYTNNALNGVILSNSYDAFLRRTNISLLKSPATVLASWDYSFDNAGRLFKVGQNGYYASYTYENNSSLISQIKYMSNATTRMTTIKQYDKLDRLQTISSAPLGGGQWPISFSYQYNDANLRTRSTSLDGSYWDYEYDSLGQVKSGKRYWADQTPVAGQQFEYTFDDIGNRKITKAGGDEAGASLRTAYYTNNLLNQITSYDVPGIVDVMGIGLETNSVMVNGQPTYRKGEYFRKELIVTNTSAAVWQPVIVESPGQSGVTGHVAVAKTPVTTSLWYDQNGNINNDGYWTRSWDYVVNRMYKVNNYGAAPSTNSLEERWSYLPDGKWIDNTTYFTKYGTNYFVTNRYVWDGDILLAVLDHTNNLVMSFMRGTDMSGTLQGAGGVGGLLAVSFATNGTHFAAYDGNGNVAGLVSGADGTVSANYEYDPFGRTLRANGPVAKLNPIRFSTQYEDDATGDLKYRFRDYMPGAGRWTSRDPIEELGGYNVYCFVGNNAVSRVDPQGKIAFDTALDALVLGVDLATGAGWPTIALDVAALAIPLGPNPRGGIIIQRLIKGEKGWERRSFELVDNALLKEVVEKPGIYIPDLASRPRSAAFKLEYRGRRPNDVNGQYAKHFQYFASTDEKAKRASMNGAAQFAPGIDDFHVREMINEAFKKYKKEHLFTYYSEINGYVYDAGVAFGKGGQKRLRVGYANGQCTTKIQLQIGKDGHVHAFPTDWAAGSVVK